MFLRANGARRLAARSGAAFVFCLALALGCGQSQPAGTGSTAAPAGVCGSALATQVASDSTGHALANAYQEHVPTDDEVRTLAAFAVLLADGVQKGKLAPVLFQTDILQSLAAISLEYPSLFRACTLPPLTAMDFPLRTLSGPSPITVDCNKDCSPDVSDVAAVMGKEAAGKAVEAVAGLAVDEPALADALGGYLTSGGKTVVNASAAVTGGISLTTAEGIVAAIGGAADTVGAVANATVLLSGQGATTTLVLRTLGSVNILILYAELNVAVLKALDSFAACVQQVDEGCAGQRIDLCYCTDGTLSDCVPPCAPCVDPYNPKSCRPPLNGGAPIDDGGQGDAGQSVVQGDGGAVTPCGASPCASGTFCNAVGQCLPNPPGGCATLCGTTCCPPGEACDLGSCVPAGEGGAVGNDGAGPGVDAGSDAPGGSYSLTVNLVGAGSQESVASSDGSINCGPGPVVAPCSATYPAGTQVTLTATVGDNRYMFGGWSGGGCSGTGDCTTSIDAAKTVTASFHATLTYTSRVTFTVPTGISSVNVQLWGGGGQGGFVGAFSGALGCYTGTGGGGGGAYAAGSVAVVAGSMYPVTVGCGGCVTSPDPKQYNLGGPSSVGSLLSAGGGQGGYDNPPNGGAGGTCTAAGCTPGSPGTAGSISSCKGGNGGAAGGPGGGAGGVYGTNFGNGASPGGGGAGSEGIAGGIGASGQVIVSW
jgi:Divergent InlB B-repeat domain